MIETANKKIFVRRLYDLAFNEDLTWNDWFFNDVYKDDEAFLLTNNRNPVACLFLQRYFFKYMEETVSVAYISGATTHYKARGQGFMGELLKDAMKEAYGRGDLFACLVPANRRLYFYYDRFGFSTVFYNKIERYSALHTFPKHEAYTVVGPNFSDFNLLENQCVCGIIHSEEDFKNIKHDIAHDNGIIVQVNDSYGNVAAMAFATANTDEIHVKELLGINGHAQDVALDEIRKYFNRQLPILIWTTPQNADIHQLRTRGMMRIINVEKVFSILAAHIKELNQTIKVSDNIIDQNNGIFILHNGHCQRMEIGSDLDIKLDLEVNITILTKILFSDPSIGRIFGIQTERPNISLMLD